MRCSCLRQATAFDRLKAAERELSSKAFLDMMQLTTDVSVSAAPFSASEFSIADEAQVFYRCSPIVSTIGPRQQGVCLQFVGDNPIHASKQLAVRLVADKTMPCVVSLLDLLSIQGKICIAGDNFWGIFNARDGLCVRFWTTAVACAQNMIRSITLMNEMILFGSQDGFVRVYANASIVEEFPAHMAPVSYIMSARVGNRSLVLTASDDGEVKAWDVVVGSGGVSDIVLLATAHIGNETVRGYAQVAESMSIIIVTRSGKAIAWNLENGSLEWKPELAIAPMWTTKHFVLEVKETEVIVRSKTDPSDCLALDLGGMKIEHVECSKSFIAISSGDRVRIWKAAQASKKDQKLQVQV